MAPTELWMRANDRSRQELHKSPLNVFRRVLKRLPGGDLVCIGFWVLMSFFESFESYIYIHINIYIYIYIICMYIEVEYSPPQAPFFDEQYKKHLLVYTLFKKITLSPLHRFQRLLFSTRNIPRLRCFIHLIWKSLKSQTISAACPFFPKTNTPNSYYYVFTKNNNTSWRIFSAAGASFQNKWTTIAYVCELSWNVNKNETDHVANNYIFPKS